MSCRSFSIKGLQPFTAASYINDGNEDIRRNRPKLIVDFSGANFAQIADFPELDEYIQNAATQYPVETMAVVDRNILRLAIWELLTDDAAPAGAVVNEAVELAHRYGGESTPGFVNGVLRTVSERIQAARAASRAPTGAVVGTPEEN